MKKQIKKRMRAVLALSLLSALVVPVQGAELALVTVKKEMLPVERWVDGKVQAVRQATVSAETSARVQEILYDVGDKVPVGAVILKLVSTEQQQGYNQAAAVLAEARANHEVQQREFERIEEIYRQKLVASADYDRAAGNLNTAKARMESATAAVKSAQQRLSYTLVKAPFGGTVYARHVELGEAVQPGKPLMTGFDPRTLRVEADLPQSVASQVAGLRKARVVSDEGESIVPSKLLLFPYADQATATVHLRLELPEMASPLRPGKFVKVALVVGEQDRLLVPVSSVGYRSEVTAVYVQPAGKKIPVLRQVRLGNRFGDQFEVLAGLAEGEQVAVDAVAAAIVVARAASHE